MIAVCASVRLGFEEFGVPGRRLVGLWFGVSPCSSPVWRVSSISCRLRLAPLQKESLGALGDRLDRGSGSGSQRGKGVRAASERFGVCAVESYFGLVTPSHSEGINCFPSSYHPWMRESSLELVSKERLLFLLSVHARLQDCWILIFRHSLLGTQKVCDSSQYLACGIYEDLR